MNKLSVRCSHIKGLKGKDKIHAIKHCKDCKDILNEKCNHSEEERELVGTWSTIEINKALEKGYQLSKIYELEHFEKTSTNVFKSYVDKFMKYKQEASGCKCNYDICPTDCKNDNKCETKIQYIIDNAAYTLDIDKVIFNAGLRFIAKMCLNSFWGHFGMRESLTQKEYCFNIEQVINIVFNDKYDDVDLMIIDEDIILTEYKDKKDYSKPNPSVNVYIALFTTAHARLKLYELLDILQERVLYLDTDSCVYHDDGSEACREIEKMLGKNLGDLTDEIISKHNAKHITTFVSAGPKDYSMKLDTGKMINCCKGFRLNAEVEKKLTLDNKIKIITEKDAGYETICYTPLKINNRGNIRTVSQDRTYDFSFDKRIIHKVNDNLIKSLPHGY